MSPAVYIPPSTFWTFGTSNPSGGSSGDCYLKTDGTNVLSVWKNVAGTWTNLAAFGTGSGSGGAGSTAAVTVTGTQDGSNKVFTLSSAITAGVGLVFFNGQLLIPGASNDYVISGTTLTVQAACPAPKSTDVLQAFGYTDTANVVAGTAEVAVTGTQNGSNKSFTISNAINGVGLVFYNGQLLTSGGSSDYTISGTSLTFTSAGPTPISTDVIRVMGYISSPVAAWTSGTAVIGGPVLLAVLTASNSASLDFVIPSGFDSLVIEVSGFTPATNGAIPYVRFSANGGTSYDTSAINNWAQQNLSFSGTLSNNIKANDSGLVLFGDNVGGGISNAQTPALAGRFTLFDLPSTTAYKTIVGTGYAVYSNAARYQFSMSGVYLSTTAVNAVRVVMSSGNITTGIVRIYGVVKS